MLVPAAPNLPETLTLYFCISLHGDDVWYLSVYLVFGRNYLEFGAVYLVFGTGCDKFDIFCLKGAKDEVKMPKGPPAISQGPEGPVEQWLLPKHSFNSSGVYENLLNIAILAITKPKMTGGTPEVHSNKNLTF